MAQVAIGSTVTIHVTLKKTLNSIVENDIGLELTLPSGDKVFYKGTELTVTNFLAPTTTTDGGFSYVYSNILEGTTKFVFIQELVGNGFTYSVLSRVNLRGVDLPTTIELIAGVK